MSTIVNERDMLLRDTVPRNIDQSAGKLLLLGADAPVFQVGVGGAGSPEAITFKANPINIPGVVGFSVTAGATLTGTGSSRSLKFTDMKVGQATVTAQIAYQGVTYSASQIVTKVTDGANGPRGSQTLYVAGSSWTDAAADAATGGANMVGDTVTISNGGTFALVKTWSGTAWVPPGVVIDGSLVVTNSITAAKINSNGLVIRDAGGNVILGAGAALDWGKLTASGLAGAGGILNSSVTLGGLGFTGASNANYTTNTNQLADGAGLGATAAWSGVSGAGRPADNATVGASFGVNIGGQITPGNVSTYIASAAIGNAQIGGDIYSSNWNYGATGWYLSRTGDFYANSGVFRGHLVGGAYTGYAWPAASQSGFYLGPAGLLLGNANTPGGGYFQVTASGDVSAPGFTISGRSATFSGQLNAAQGTFSGTLSAAQGTFGGTLTAANAVVTDNIIANGISDVENFGRISKSQPFSVARDSKVLVFADCAYDANGYGGFAVCTMAGAFEFGASASGVDAGMHSARRAETAGGLLRQGTYQLMALSGGGAFIHTAFILKVMK